MQNTSKSEFSPAVLFEGYESKDRSIEFTVTEDQKLFIELDHFLYGETLTITLDHNDHAALAQWLGETSAY